MATDEDAPDELVKRAIGKRVCIAAQYNRARVLLAPHSLFARHDELYLRAVTLAHDERKPREAKLGTFKIAGLRDIELTRKLFTPRSAFAGLVEEYPATEPAAPQVRRSRIP